MTRVGDATKEPKSVKTCPLQSACSVGPLSVGRNSSKLIDVYFCQNEQNLIVSVIIVVHFIIIYSLL